MIIGILQLSFLGLVIYYTVLGIKNEKIENEILELKRKKELADYERFKARYHFLKDVFDLDEDE